MEQDLSGFKMELTKIIIYLQHKRFINKFSWKFGIVTLLNRITIKNELKLQVGVQSVTAGRLASLPA